MPIQRLLQEASFGPDEVACMTAAYDCVLRELRLVDRTDPICEIVGRKIIEVTRTGERDPVRICNEAIQQLRGAGQL